jgi:hypothetical protein
LREAADQANVLDMRSVLLIAAAIPLAACAVDISSRPPGTSGPPGPVGRYAVATAMADTEIGTATDILVARASLRATLPSAAAAGAGRAITLRCAATCAALTILPSGTDRIEGGDRLVIEDGEMVTLAVEATGTWTVVSASDL